ncbi:helix-turn-helix transcriptional regulator [Delftia sp. UME58]|uniref:helix-turn-helix domain-containing protein n=1 Tax=Delftia sp. UME58 TaxID=1862322 RepID=UPI0016009512|nr:helix-turn-helix transcriptional regulator [Delftia sp. UME58]MBB1651690.1 hypothetical protein [Delftia sp. UME58]
MNEKEFKDRLIAAREGLGLSQSELARRVDMKPTQLARYEGGRATPRRKVIERLAVALQVNTQWLADGSAHPHEPEMTMRPDGKGMVEVTFRPDEETGRLFREIAERIGKTPDDLLNWVMTEMTKIGAAPEGPPDDIYKELSERVARLEAEAAARRKGSDG